MDHVDEVLMEVPLEEHCDRRDQEWEYYVAHLLANQVDEGPKEDLVEEALMGVLMEALNDDHVEVLMEVVVEEEHCVRRDQGWEYYMAHLLVNQVDPIAKEDPAGDALMGVLKDDPVEAVVMEDPTD